MISLEAFAALSNIPVMETSRIKRLRLERGLTLEAGGKSRAFRRPYVPG